MADIPELSMHRAGRYTQASFAIELNKLWGVPIGEIPLSVLMKMLRSAHTARNGGHRLHDLDQHFVRVQGRRQFL
jgi:hypothetical protein